MAPKWFGGHISITLGAAPHAAKQLSPNIMNSLHRQHRNVHGCTTAARLHRNMHLYIGCTAATKKDGGGKIYIYIHLPQQTEDLCRYLS